MKTLFHLLEMLDMYQDQEHLPKQPYLLDITTSGNTPTMTLQAGLVCVGSKDTSFVFSIPESITSTTTQVTDSLGNIVSQYCII